MQINFTKQIKKFELNIVHKLEKFPQKIRQNYIDELKISWNLVDIKKGRTNKTEIKIKLMVKNDNTEIYLTVIPKFSFGWNLMNFINSKRLANRLEKIKL